MTQAPDEKIVENIAFAIEPWDKKLADYLGENPGIERASAEEDRRKSEAMRKARAALAAARPLLEAEILREVYNSNLADAKTKGVVRQVADAHNLDLTTDSKNGEG